MAGSLMTPQCWCPAGLDGRLGCVPGVCVATLPGAEDPGVVVGDGERRGRLWEMERGRAIDGVVVKAAFGFVADVQWQWWAVGGGAIGGLFAGPLLFDDTLPEMLAPVVGNTLDELNVHDHTAGTTSLNDHLGIIQILLPQDRIDGTRDGVFA